MSNSYFKHCERGFIGVFVACLALINGIMIVGCYLIGLPFALLSRLCGRIPHPTMVVYLAALSKTCKNCHWYERPGNGTHECSCPKMVYGYGPRCDSDGVDVEDDEGWGMVPGPDFGCIHFKHKEITHA